MSSLKRFEEFLANSDSLLKGTIKSEDPLSACLYPLLKSLGWNGHQREIIELLPHCLNRLSMGNFIDVFQKLDYEPTLMQVKLSDMDERLFPCLFLPEKLPAMILLGSEEDKRIVYSGADKKIHVLSNLEEKGCAYIFKKSLLSSSGKQEKKRSWFSSLLREYRGLISQVLVISFLVNLIALATPLFIMAVYNWVITTESISMLLSFLFGLGIALIGMVLLNIIRMRILAFISTKLDNSVGEGIFQKIISLPLSLTENATVGGQLARIKSLDSVREFFTSPLCTLIIDLPFILIFLITIVVLGGNLALIPIGMIACFGVFGWMIKSTMAKNVAVNSTNQSAYQSFLIETLNNQRSIKYTSSEEVWLKRHKLLAAEEIMASHRSNALSLTINNISNFIMMSGGVLILSLGAVKAIEGSMSAGALIAVILLTWRVITPLKQLFTSFSYLTQVNSSIKQINQLMGMDPDPGALEIKKKHVPHNLNISFQRIFFSYERKFEAALANVNFEMRHGELAMLVGSNGSGKSSILKLLLQVYLPQSGSMRIGGMDLRQIEPRYFRSIVGYVPQTPHFFYGSIAQNIRLSNPLATDDEIYEACRLAGVYESVLSLKAGFNTRIGDQSKKSLPVDFQQKLSLARAYVKKPKILLLDEPVTGLDHGSEKAFWDVIDRLKERASVMMVTHRLDHLKKADRIFHLKNGCLIEENYSKESLIKISGEREYDV